MPFHGFRNFRDCLRHIRSTGKSEEQSARICGALRSKEEGIFSTYEAERLSYEELLQDHETVHVLMELGSTQWGPRELEFLSTRIHKELEKRGHMWT